MNELIYSLNFLAMAGFSNMDRSMKVRKVDVVSEPATVKVLISSTNSSAFMLHSSFDLLSSRRS